MRGSWEEGTLDLMKLLLRDIRRHERLARARFFRWPKRKARLLVRQRNVTGELMVRYGGVILQILRRRGIAISGFARELVKIAVGLQDGARTLQDPLGFPALFWQVCTGEGGGEVEPLKAKFMLRLFVDELPASEARGVLRLHYGSLGEAPADDRERLRLLALAYPHLHHEVLRHRKDLEVLTDGVLSPELLDNLKPPFAIYDRWLSGGAVANRG